MIPRHRPHFVSRSILRIAAICICSSVWLAPEISTWAQQAGGFRYLEVKVEDDTGQSLTTATLDIVTSDMEFPLPVDDEGIAAFNLTFQQDQSGYLNLTARADGYAAQQVWWRGKNIPEEYTFRLLKGTEIGGIVQDSSGRPIAGATVEGLLVSEETSTSGVPAPHLNGELATTDRDGKWSTRAAPSGDFEMRLKLTHPRYFSDQGFGKRRISAEKLKSLTHVEVLEELIPPQGTVVDSHRQAVSEAAIYLLDEEETLWLENAVPSAESEAKPLVVTDSTGKFELAPSEGQSMLLVLADSGWALVRSDRFSKNKPIEVRLTPWAVAEGTLMDGGTPVADTELEITVLEKYFYDGDASAWWTYTTRTDAQGKFRCERLLAGPAIVGRSVPYNVPGEERLTDSATEAQFILHAGEATQVEIKRTGRTISGYVVGIQENGVDITPRCGLIYLEKQEIASDIVENIFFTWGQALSINSEGFQVRTEPVVLGTEGTPLIYLAAIDGEGRFEANHIPPGDYEVSVSLERKLPGNSESQWFWGSADESITIAPDSEGKNETMDLGELEIEVYSDDEE